MYALVLNCGSSSLKFELFEVSTRRSLLSGQYAGLGTQSTLDYKAGAEKGSHEFDTALDHAAALGHFSENWPGWLNGQADSAALDFVVHRVVHGGSRFTGTVLIDAEVEQTIEDLFMLAPLHNPANLTGIKTARRLYDCAHYAAFDTAFHQTMPPEAYRYAVPAEWYAAGVRRYGFHGNSHGFMLEQTAACLGKKAADTSLISAHLGNGASVCAVQNGQSADTSMGLSPLEGLVMGTRSGDVDPAVFEFMQQHGYDTAAVTRQLNKESGLLGLSGKSRDMRTLLESEGSDENCRLAVGVFVHRLRRYIGAYLTLGAVDALVFTGGIGENSADIRQRSTSGLEHLGIVIDEERNRAAGKEDIELISADHSAIRVLVIKTDEELYMLNSALTQRS